jgi:hypothetical protein
MRFVEQLGAIASQRGIHRFDAEVLESNAAMLRVFEHAGYAVRHRGSRGELTLSVDLTPTEALRERIDARDHGNPTVAQRLGEAKADLAESDEHDVMAGGSRLGSDERGEPGWLSLRTRAAVNTATSVSAAMMLITDRSLNHAGPASLVGASATVARARVLK